MKRLFAVVGCTIIIACCLFASSCAGGNVFVFLSVRMKGNGDGSITAVAQKEFSVGKTDFPVTLTLYYSAENTNEVSGMREVESLTQDSLDSQTKFSIVSKVEEEGYFLARISYTVGGETRYIQSETINYGTDGNRKK